MPDAVPGKKFRVTANEWNAMQAAARAFAPRSGGVGSSAGLGPGLVFVRNSGQVPLAMHAAVGFSGSGYPVNGDSFRSDAPIARCYAVNDPSAPFAILLQPLEPGETGLARYEGFAVIRVRPPTGGGAQYRAAPTVEDAFLKVKPSGPVEVVARQNNTADEDGLVWALVLLGHPEDAGGDVMLAVVSGIDSQNVEPDGLYTVYLSPPGIDSVGNGSIATFALTDVCQGARLPAGTALLAHRVAVRSIVDGGDD